MTTTAVPMDLVPTENTTTVVDSQHQDYIYQIAFDHYGRRVATISNDRHVRIWDLNDGWHMAAEWQAHRGTTLSWAHPEYGSLLATGSVDQDVKIWEERSNDRWVAKASLTEARRAVTKVEFAPRHLGLKLAVGSADGYVRIYEAVDIMNLAQWPLAATLQPFQDGNKLGCSCLSWCTGRFEPPTLVVGGSHLVVYRYSEAARAWQSILQLPSPEQGGVLDVAWAPNVGRRFHYIASAEDRQLRIYKFYRDMSEDKAENKPLLKLESSQARATSAWRCQWNVTGTVLASAGDMATVNLWKADHTGQFQLVSEVQGNISQVANQS